MTNIRLAEKYGIEAKETSIGNENSNIQRVYFVEHQVHAHTIKTTEVLYKSGRVVTFHTGNEPKTVREFLNNVQYRCEWDGFLLGNHHYTARW